MQKQKPKSQSALDVGVFFTVFFLFLGISLIIFSSH